MQSFTGRLVVASHELTDANFRRAVVLVLAHDAEGGAAGVVLNRPVPGPLPTRLQRWEPLAAPPAVVFRGGPVAPDTVLAVAASRAPAALHGWQPVLPDLGVIDLTGDVDEARDRVDAIRLFVGYAGWGPGQLEGEVAAGAWFVVDARRSDPLAPEPDALWRAVLARQGGMFTTVPDDPALN